MTETGKQNVESLFGHPIPNTHAEPDADLIDILEDTLEKAKAGEIVALHGVATFSDDATGQVRAGIYPIRKVIGEMELMKAGMIAAYDDSE